MQSWVITSLKNKGRNEGSYSYSYKGDSFRLYSEQPIEGTNQVKILIDGHVLPRDNISIGIAYERLEDNLSTLFHQNKARFINGIKGNFIIIACNKESFHIYTDRIGIKKAFYWYSGDSFIISNDIDNIIQNVKPNISPDNLLIHSLLHHFPNEITMFKDIHYTKNATHIEFQNNNLTTSQYWNYGDLLSLEKKKVSYNRFSRKFFSITSDYLDYLKPNNVSLTLTGGMDSRTILAALLFNNVKPTTFTFGDPEASDVTVAEKIATFLGLEQYNYFTEQKPDFYSDLVDKTLKNSNGLTHLHRAHRLDAIRQHKKQKPDCDLLFVGHMGGEGIRGLTYNDYFASPFFENVNEGKWDIQKGLKKIAKEYYNKLSNIDLGKITEFISNLDYFQNDKKLNKYYFLYELVASIHHAQDINIYNRYIKHVIPIYLDIDYLELLFSTDYSLLNKNSRLENPELYCQMINTLHPRLSRFQFSNNFSPKEYLDNKYLCAAKKIIRDSLGTDIVNSFDYSDWYVKFVDMNIHHLHPFLKDFFDVDNLLHDFKTSDHKTREGYWHKFSNPIMFSRLLYNFEL